MDVARFVITNVEMLLSGHEWDLEPLADAANGMVGQIGVERGSISAAPHQQLVPRAAELGFIRNRQDDEPRTHRVAQRHAPSQERPARGVLPPFPPAHGPVHPPRPPPSPPLPTL